MCGMVCFGRIAAVLNKKGILDELLMVGKAASPDLASDGVFEYKLMDLSLCKTDGDGRSLGSFVSPLSWSDRLSLTLPKAAALELLEEKVEEK
ncbi:hypothetical protein Gotri_020994 [Gossypium trilobum]|uniref:Uncharacterized protein n=4 Tax=Gossypium TaxID=3633 RepID=A0A7J9DBB2_9ROSI|nr:hypothetical protein [Gossypium trilobum]